jgi:hypothetical protein
MAKLNNLGSLAGRSAQLHGLVLAARKAQQAQGQPRPQLEEVSTECKRCGVVVRRYSVQDGETWLRQHELRCPKRPGQNPQEDVKN